MKRSSFFLSTLLSFAILLGAPSIWACSDHCASPFGQLIGGTVISAYSNCRKTCVSPEQNFTQTSFSQREYTGTKWQCVEYARRWLLTQYGVRFGIVRFAHQIWDLATFEDAKTHQSRKIIKYRNESSKEAPQLGDLLIYSKKRNFGTGHVAVISGVEEGKVAISEQNVSNEKWPDPNYSRKLPLRRSASGLYSIEDEFIQGWIRLQN